MNKKMYGLLAGALLMGMASCSDDNPWADYGQGRGAIKLSISADGSVVKAGPATRATETLEDVPDVEDFSIRLQKEDGSFSRDYANLAKFRQESSFPTGTYTLTALYGDPTELGFDCPAYAGSTSVTVLEGLTSEAQVTAKVANALVTVSYTDDFKSYLHDYSAELHTEGQNYLEIAADETRQAYIAPGNVKLAVQFSNPQNQSVKIEPVAFKALAGHHYKIELDVNGGEIGQASLQIEFTDELTPEEVVIDLTEELFTSPAPSVSGEGFGDELIEFLTGEAPEGKYRFNILSYGGLKEALLTISSKEFSSSFGNEVNLIGASGAIQGELQSLGVEAKGIFKNPDRMAYIDCTNLPKNVPSGVYEVSVRAKDAYNRVSEAVTFRFNSVAPTISAEGVSAVAGLNEGTVYVTYNGSHPESDITFQALNRLGTYVDAEVKGYVEETRTRALESHSYTYTIKLPDTDREAVKVKVFLYGKESAVVDLPVVQPEYTLEADGFATKALIRVNADQDIVGSLAGNLNLYDSTGKKVNIVSRNTEDGIVTVDGLSSGNKYTLRGSMNSTLGADAPSVTFETEAASNVANGDFSSVAQSLYIQKLNAGFIYEVTYTLFWQTFKHNYRNLTSIDVSMPTGWGDSNAETCNYDASNNKNTWYVVPSALYDVNEGGVRLRSVGYNRDGREVEKSTTADAGAYFSTSVPTQADLVKTAGKMYYGSGENGTEFHSRPSSLSFDYKFIQVGGESGDARVVVYSGDTKIGEGNVVVGDAQGTATANVKYIADGTLFGKKATRLAVIFRSSTAATPQVVIPTGSDLKDNYASTPKTGNMGDIGKPEVTDGWGHTLEANSYKSFAKGCELIVSNINLKY